MSRARGYTYARRRDGSKYRIYGNPRTYGRIGGRPRQARRNPPSRAGGRTTVLGDTIMGYGAYFRGRSSGASRKIPYSRPVPAVVNSPHGIIVRHKEFIADVPSSIAFSSLILPLNPGLNNFPWLHRVAQCFEEWLPRGMVVEYRTTSSDTLLAANPALGSVIIATQYNSLNNDFINKQEMENYEGAVSCKPSANMLHQIECKRSQTVMDEMYIRTGPVPTGGDIRLYDLGKTQVSTVGSQLNGSAIGEIWISYEVELRKPKIPSDPIVEAAHWTLDPAEINGTETAVRPFGTGAFSYAPEAGSTMTDARVGSSGAANGFITLGALSRGDYLVCCHFPWTTPGTQGAWTVTPVTNCALRQYWVLDTLTVAQEIDAGTATAATTELMFVVRATGPLASMTITSSSTCAGGYAVAADVWICELPNDM